MPAEQEQLDDFLRLLQLEPIDVDLHRGYSPPESPTRVFGGQVAAQALIAAGRTVPDGRQVHSLHAYFVRPGDPSIPIVYRTEEIRDGGSFSTRRVLAIQRGEAIFAMAASFQVAQEGLAHAEPMPLGVPAPEELPDRRHDPGGEPGGHPMRLPALLDVRLVDEPLWTEGRAGTDEPVRAWMRADGVVPADPLLHVCLITYCSDLTLLGSVVARHPVSVGRLQMASLDHAMWFHAPARADDWLLYECYSPAASGGRGLAQGRFFTRDGRLVVSTMQEGLVRFPRH